MKILIIKTGLTETFDLSNLHPEIVSLGDVLRTTAILHAFLKDDVTWLTSSQSMQLLSGISEINRVIDSRIYLNASDFDLVINLERDIEILNWLQPVQNKVLGYIGIDKLRTSSEVYSLAMWLELDSVKKLNWSEKLYAILEKEWCGQDYFVPMHILDKSRENTFDIGLNWQVGIKWPTKIWPKERWSGLEVNFSSDYKISWQEGFYDLGLYMNWINSCKVLVTHDSLGLHIAKALKKEVIVLFGPTSSLDTPLTSKSRALSAQGIEGFDCLPCYKDHCHNKIHCMDYLSVDYVTRELKDLLRQMQ